MATSDNAKPHKNIRGKEYYAQIAELASVKTPIQRLSEFAKWAQSQKMCKSERDFERVCGLSPKYISNNMHTGKGNIGTEMLGRVVKAFPQLNLVWICTGEGDMLTVDGIRIDYKKAYEAALVQVEALNSIIDQMNAEEQ